MFDFANIEIFENSTKYDWSLLPNSKFVIEIGVKRTWLPSIHVGRMYDADLVYNQNGWIAPSKIKSRITLKGTHKAVDCNSDNLIYLNYHLRSTLNKVSTKDIMNRLMTDVANSESFLPFLQSENNLKRIC